MTKRKDAVALFDLLSKTRQERTGLDVPGWFGKPADGEPPAQTGPEAPSSPPPLEPAPFPFSPAPTEPLISAADGRVRLSMNYVTCATLAMGLVALLFVSFWLGRKTYRPPTVPAANAPTFPGRTPLGGGAGDANVPPSPWEKGKYYLIVDRMTGRTEKDLASARAIVDYLAKKGEPAQVGDFGPEGYYAVLSLKPFNSRTSKEAMDFAEAIMALGSKYVPPPGCDKYGFSQYRRGTRILDPSFHHAQ